MSGYAAVVGAADFRVTFGTERTMTRSGAVGLVIRLVVRIVLVTALFLFAFPRLPGIQYR